MDTSPEQTPSYNSHFSDFLWCCFTLLEFSKSLNPVPAEPGYTLPLQNSSDPDQLASQEAN